MFSSNPFPYLPSSTNLFLPPNSFFDRHQKDDFHFNFHQRINDVVRDPFISGQYFFHSGNTTADLIPPPIMENVTTIKQDFVQLQQQQFSERSAARLQNCEQDREDLLDSVISHYKKKSGSSKKHGHSKICTARGPRDRRVRFSIEVAQKFFSLQDLLGFDKASKTLDWLLSNSMPAIKELIEEGDDCSASSDTHQYKLKFLEAINGGISDEMKNSVVLPKCVNVVAGKKKKIRRKCKSGFNVARDQSRAEARARARERTKEKMRVKKLDGCGNNQVISPSDPTLKSADCWSEIEPQIDYKNIRWKCTRIMGGHEITSSTDQKIQALPLSKEFHEQQLASNFE